MFFPNKLRRKSVILLKNYGDYQNFLLFLLATAAGTAKIQVDRIYNQLRWFFDLDRCFVRSAKS